MSGTKLDQGAPKTLVKKDWEYFQYCGGMGGASCLKAAGIDRLTWGVKNDAFAVRNRTLILLDPGFRVYADGGASGVADCRNAGASQNIYVAVSVNGVLTVPQITAQNMITGAGPAYLEFDERLLPQPNNPLYTGYTFITAYWGNTAFVTSGGPLATDTVPYQVESNISDIRI